MYNELLLIERLGLHVSMNVSQATYHANMPQAIEPRNKHSAIKLGCTTPDLSRIS